jgi:hypothetical protein
VKVTSLVSARPPRSGTSVGSDQDTHTADLRHALIPPLMTALLYALLHSLAYAAAGAPLLAAYFHRLPSPAPAAPTGMTSHL